MDSALFLGITTRGALNRRMEVAAHNIANMNTTAFKKEKVVFEQFLVDLPNAAATSGGQISYVVDKGVRRNFSEGPLVHTGNPLDVFLSEGGFLTVENAQGETLYTRNGRMAINNEGQLTTLSGQILLDDAGAPILFPAQVNQISISSDGTITADGATVATLGIATFGNPQSLERVGDSLYKSSDDPQDPENATDVTVTSRAIEGSNVNAIESMVELLNIQRAAGSNSELSDNYSELREDAIRRLGRVARF